MLIQNTLTGDSPSHTGLKSHQLRTGLGTDIVSGPEARLAVVAGPSVAAAYPARNPERRPEAPRKTAVAAEKVIQSFNTWAFKREQPTNLPLMSKIISGAVERAEPVSFVLYWGKGPRCTIAAPDLACLDYLAKFAHRVGDAHKHGASIKLIFTDTHATLNGHSPESMQRYFTMIEAEARKRNFDVCYLGDLAAAETAQNASAPSDVTVPADMGPKLAASAKKWFHGDGTAEEAALKYYAMNMGEKRAVEFAFPNSIFITFNGSDFRDLFPDNLPIFYMYSLRRGTGVKPWFMAGETPSCVDPARGSNASNEKFEGSETSCSAFSGGHSDGQL